MKTSIAPSTYQADIALLLEGTYPYVSGGVSTWVHQIIRGLPEFSFGLIFIGASPSTYGEIKYQLPSNVVHLEKHYISDAWIPTRRKGRGGSEKAFNRSAKLHDYFRNPTGGLPPGLMAKLAEELGKRGGLSRSDFLFSEYSWKQIKENYQQHCTDPSFVDYFWTIRSMHTPLFLLSDIVKRMAAYRAYHSVCTGYAGFVGTLLHHLRSRPFILTEHGIYTKERKIDLFHAPWIKEATEIFGNQLEDDVGYLRRLWIRFFEGLGRVIYQAADPIISLYGENRNRQIDDGAPEERTRVIPNGVEISRFAPLRGERGDPPPPVVGLIGRVVPIKDIQTFIRAMHLVCSRLPAAEGWIIGPDEENPSYGEDCKSLVQQLGLKDKVKFLGFLKPEEVLSQLGLLCLTSISEGLPLVMLEGFASGLPAVTTNVGSCAQLIEGRELEDRALGPAGALVPIASPVQTAEAILGLLQDTKRWRAAQEAGIRRVEKLYTQEQMFASYRDIYRTAVEA